MGADIYLNSKYQPRRDKIAPLFEAAADYRNSLPSNSKRYAVAQAMVDHFHEEMLSEGYFRDPYNPNEFLDKVGLSWWRDIALP